MFRNVDYLQILVDLVPPDVVEVDDALLAVTYEEGVVR